MSKKFDSMFEKGLKLYKERNHSAAIIEFDKILKKDPSFIKAYNHKAATLSKLKRYTEGKEVLDKAIDLNIATKETWAVRATIFVILEEYEKSIECYQQALKLETDENSPYIPNIWRLTASAHYQFKKYKEAHKCIEKALMYSPGDKLCLRDKKWIDDGLKHGFNYYAKVLFEYDFHPWDEIIYSTKVKITWGENELVSTVIMTQNGIVISIPSYRPGISYVPWTKIKFSSNEKCIMTLNIYNITLHRNVEISNQSSPYYESEEEFELRCSKFYNTIQEAIKKVELDNSEEIPITLCPKCRNLMIDSDNQICKVCNFKFL